MNIEKLTNSSGHYFFGYYDVPAFSADNKLHLYHKAKFWKRLPQKRDEVEIGVIDIETKKVEPLAVSRAWNFQQGAMLQWNLANDDEIIFNDFDGNDYRGVILNINTGASRLLDMPVASVSPDGKWGLGINFGRVYDFRKGYGYINIPDRYKNDMLPANDGIFLVNLKTGKAKLILSYPEIWELTQGREFFGDDRKLSVNHITFGPNSNRFVFLARCFPQPDAMWLTATVTSDIHAQNLNVVQAYGFGSHYYWKNESEFLIYGDMAGEGLHLINDKTHSITTLDKNFFTFDGHCSYSTDNSTILYDCYPDGNGYRELYLYNVAENRAKTIGRFYAHPEIEWDARCDLHPRWNRDSSAISFDSVHDGMRHIYLAHSDF